MKKFLFIATLLQILLLINFSTATSYIIAESNSFETETKVEENNVLENGLKLLITFFTIKQIGTVSAEEASCCLETNEGAICQDSSYVSQNCADDLIPTPCSKVSECKLGCCIDETEGLCTTKATKKKCEDDGGTWEEGESCLNLECQRGCCVLGNDVSFVTETRCEQLSLLDGFSKDFRDISTEFECLLLKETEKKGACVLTEGACKFGLESECLQMQGTFYENYLCSNPSISTNCEKQADVSCVEGFDEIYWIDSCGNRENIYNSDTDFSWNEGMVLEKNESCNADSENIDSETCGNCNYMLGSKCEAVNDSDTHIEDGNFVCENKNCIDADGNFRKNGESWCVYDSFIGDGKDTAGSRHWKRMCIDGEIKVEPCADYRGQICVETQIEKDDESVSIANCVINEALACLEYNQKKDMTSCSENTACVVKDINIDDNFRFNICVPKYPKGFDLSDEYGGTISQEICSTGDQTCTMIYEKKWDSWHCISNCNCKNAIFGEQMNDLCVSLGDCGSYINYIGEGSNNVQISNSPKPTWQKYTSYANPVEGQYAEVGDLSSFFQSLESTPYQEKESQTVQSIEFVGKIVGGAGAAVGALEWFAQENPYELKDTLGLTNFLPDDFQVSNYVFGGEATGFTGAFSGASIGFFVGGIIAKTFGFTGENALIISLGAGVAGGVAGYFASSAAASAAAIEAGLVSGGASAAGAAQAGSAIYAAESGFASFGGALGPTMAALAWAAIIAISIVIIMKIMGIGNTKEVKVTFKCLPWQQPTGGEHCEECDDDPLKPCSKYRCNSLGQACGYINGDSENPSCVKLYEDDGEAPTISPLNITPGYEFLESTNNGVKIRGAENECIPEFTPVAFVLETNEHSQCKYNYEGATEYEDLDSYFLESTLYGINHTGVFMLPSIHALGVYNLTGDLKEMYGNMNMYVRCQDTYGIANTQDYIVNFCVKTGPDFTPAIITKTTPTNNSYKKYNVSEMDLTVYTNEPANCKYDYSANKSYADMSTYFNCNTDINSYTDYGWQCNTTLTELSSGDQNIYIKCKDQPWLPDSNTSRNINAQDFVYSIRESKDKLIISSIEPDGYVENGFEPVSVTLKIKTEGGAENGKATCYYSFKDSTDSIQFYNTFSTVHTQTFDFLMRGTHVFELRCVDAGNNVVEQEYRLEVGIDTTPPEAVRAYNDNGALLLLTDEKAKCYYDLTRCNFDIENGTSMTTLMSTSHTAEWNPSWTYHIRCKDIWGNAPSSCTIKVLPSI